jgi:large subunit ribosomal protein L4
MIEIPVHNSEGQQVDTLQIDEQLLGGEVQPGLLKQAYVRYHANHRQGTAATKGRSQVEGSTRKLYKQKHTGNARRGAIRTNIMRGGGRGHRKTPHSWRLDMPVKMRRLANRNALLAKAVDGEIKILDRIQFEKPSTQQFAHLLTALKIDRTCLIALSTTQCPAALSARNLDHCHVTGIDRLNAFDLLNHRYLLVDKATLAGWLERARTQVSVKAAAATEEAR